MDGDTPVQHIHALIETMVAAHNRLVQVVPVGENVSSYTVVEGLIISAHAESTQVVDESTPNVVITNVYVEAQKANKCEVPGDGTAAATSANVSVANAFDVLTIYVSDPTNNSDDAVLEANK